MGVYCIACLGLSFTIVVCGCEPPSPAASPAPVPTYRALVMGPKLDDDGIAATVPARLARGPRLLANQHVALLRGGTPSLPPYSIANGTTDDAGALTISMDSASPLHGAKGCTVMGRASSGAGVRGLRGANRPASGYGVNGGPGRGSEAGDGASGSGGAATTKPP